MTVGFRIAVSAVLALIVAACAKPRDDGIVLSGWVSSPFESDAMEAIVDRYRSDYPESRLAYHPIQANYIEKIQLMLGTNTAPDVFMLEAFWAPSLIEYETLMPLDEFIASDATFDIDDFEPSLLEAFRSDGELYGIPKDYSTTALFYNPTMLEAAGLQGPPTTWEELEEYARRLTVTGDQEGAATQHGLAFSESLEAILPFVWQNGGQLVDRQGQIDLADQRAIEAIEFLYRLRQEGLAALPTDLGASWNMEAFGRGRVAMAMSGLWAVNFLDTTFAGTPYRVAPLPKGERGSSMAFVVGYVIPRGTERPEQAWELLRYLTSKEGQGSWSELNLGLSPRQSVIEQSGALEDSIKAVFINAAAESRTWQLGPNQRLLDELQTAMQSVFLTDTPIEEALRRADDRLRKQSVQ